jgi:site-specific DNA recombinase
MLSLTTFADELEREKARQRTYDAMLRKARARHVTGGRVFGYDNVDVTAPEGGRSHVMRRVNEAEADVVRRIFVLASEGYGLTRITKALNEQGVPAPRAQQRRPAGWVGSTVREVLLRPLYRGEIVWNQTRKRDRWGLANRSTRPPEDRVTVVAPDLRIVSDELWTEAHRRFAERQQKYATVGRRRLDIESPYLLSGLARCAICAGGLAAHTRSHGTGKARRPVHFFACTSFLRRGPNVSANNLVGRMDVVDEEVIATLQDDTCRPAVIEEAIRLALEELAPGRQGETRERLQAELAAVRDECDRLAEAIGRGGPLDALVARLQARQAHRITLERESACARWRIHTSTS